MPECTILYTNLWKCKFLLGWFCSRFFLISGGFPRGSVVKNPPANAGDVRDLGLVCGLGRSPGEGNGNLLQYSCLENPMDRSAWSWWATVHRVTNSRTRLKRLSRHACWFLRDLKDRHIHTLTFSTINIYWDKLYTRLWWCNIEIQSLPFKRWDVRCGHAIMKNSTAYHIFQALDEQGWSGKTQGVKIIVKMFY